MRALAFSRSCLAIVLGLFLIAPMVRAEVGIIAPSVPGSSWDQLAQALKASLAEDPDGEGVDVRNLPGAGGIVGLRQFLAEASDDAVLVTGLTMLDAALVQRVPVGLDQLTPIARLATEPFAVAVPASSPYRSFDDLRAAMAEDGAKVAWAGGPGGGIDHVAAMLLSGAIGADVGRLVYVPFLTSADAATALAEGRVAAAILSAGEFAADVKAGRVRLLAVTAPARVPNIEAPALAESGIGLDLANWRGVLGRPGLPAARHAVLVDRISRAAATPAWREFLDRKGWQEAFLPPDAFARFLAAEQERVKAALDAAGLPKR